jgi:hypothetical protein
MDGAGGGWVVDEQDGGHNVVVGSVRLHGARDGVVRDEVLDRVLGVKQVRVYFIFSVNIINKIYGQHPLSNLFAPFLHNLSIHPFTVPSGSDIQIYN